MRKDFEQIIESAAERAAQMTIKKLQESDRLKKINAPSFKKTESLLFLYSKLAEDHPDRLRIDRALRKIDQSEYKDVIASYYFDGIPLTELSEIYDCKYQTICKQRNKLIKVLSRELFPEDVLRELLEK